jgi:hypothetical protein
VYLIVAAGFGYGRVGAAGMWRPRSRRGGARSIATGGGSRVGDRRRLRGLGGRTLPYLGDIPMAVWVVLMATVLSREYADRGERLAAGERRFRAVLQRSVGVRVPHAARRHAHPGQPRGADGDGPRVPTRCGEAVCGHAVVEPRPAAPRSSARCGGGRGARLPVKFEAHASAADGTMSWADCSMSAVRDGRGEVTMLVSESRDVTERVRAHEALLMSGARYRTLIDSAPERSSCSTSPRELRGLQPAGVRDVRRLGGRSARCSG